MGRLERSNVDAATITRYALILLGFILLVLVLYSIRTLLAVVYISLIVAAALHPLALLIQRRMPRAMALINIYLVLIGLVLLFFILILPPLVLQLGSFLTVLPEQARQVRAFLDAVDFWLAESGVPINLAAIAEQVGNQIGGLLFRVVEIPLVLYEIGASLFAIVALSFYWLLDRTRLLNSLFALLPEHKRGRARAMYIRSEQQLGSFVRGLAFASVILGIVTYLGLTLLGVPFPLLLAIVAAVLEVIPIIGPVIAGIPIVGLAFIQSPGLGIATLVFWIGVQLLEGNVLTPLVQRQTVRLPPFTILLSLLMGGALLGILGALLAIPTAVLINIILNELAPDRLSDRDQGRSTPTP